MDTEQMKAWEESYNWQKGLCNNDRTFFVACILSDVQECMYAKRTETIREFDDEANYHLSKSVEEGLITEDMKSQVEILIMAGEVDYCQKLASESYEAKYKWEKYVQESCNFLNRAKRIIFDHMEEVRRSKRA